MFAWRPLRRRVKGVAAIGPDAIIAAIVVCILLVLTAVAVTARQLGTGRQQTALSPPQPGAPPRLDSSPFSDDPEWPTPVRFHQYAVSELARGGVGTIYRSIHPENGRVYAIKQLSRQFVADQLVVEAFHRGADMLKRIRHPNIVKVYYDWPERSEGWIDHFVIMEFLPGETLHDLIRREAPLPLDDRFMNIIRGIGEAISYLHSHEIIHRDIKPENFRLSDGRYKLLDFDTSISRAHRGSLPQDGMPVGTPEYMSPEQARGAADIDPRADIYSFGMLLYELLTGNVPFTGAPSRVLIDQMETAPRSPRFLNGSMPPAVADIILMALHKDRERRFQTVQALFLALQNAYAAAQMGRSASEGGPRQ